jgi:hypothetical protein
VAGVFAELGQATVSFVMSACSRAVHVDQLGFHMTNFHEIFNFYDFSQICRYLAEFFME